MFFSFNSQPPEGGWMQFTPVRSTTGRFNSQPPEGGWENMVQGDVFPSVFQLTAARRRLVGDTADNIKGILFQLTAARRRLAIRYNTIPSSLCFNSQPPEGGWVLRNGDS